MVQEVPTNPIPLVDLKAQYRSIKPEVDVAVQRILDNTSFIMGQEVTRFEDAYADFCGADYAIGVASGTAAIHLALLALDVGPGDEVITVSHTFIASAEPIAILGARPVFVDVDPLYFTLDPDKLEAAITPRTKVIMPVHLYGQCADMDAINAIAAKHGIPVIEDAAQAHGATYRGATTGQLAPMACFSFYPGKNLGAYGDAGAVVTNDSALRDRIARLRNHGRRDKYVHDEVGYGERLDAMQAAILGVKLRYLAQWNERRRHWASRYDELLQEIPEISLPSIRPESKPVFHLYVIQVNDGNSQTRDALIAHLKENGVMAGIHYPLPLHLQPAFDNLGYQKGDFPVTEQLAETIISLPIFPELTDDDIQHVAKVVRRFFSGEMSVDMPNCTSVAVA